MRVKPRREKIGQEPVVKVAQLLCRKRRAAPYFAKQRGVCGGAASEHHTVLAFSGGVEIFKVGDTENVPVIAERERAIAKHVGKGG